MPVQCLRAPSQDAEPFTQVAIEPSPRRRVVNVFRSLLLLRAAFEASRIRTAVVKRSDKPVKGFIVLLKRRIVERTFGWINRLRRLANDFEILVASSLAWFMLAVSFLLIPRTARDYKPAA
jgi:transposase